MLERTNYHTKGDKHCTGAFSSAIEGCSQQYKFTVILTKIWDMYSDIIGSINDSFSTCDIAKSFISLTLPTYKN